MPTCARTTDRLDVRLLLICESAPESDAAESRFFYAPSLTGADSLFRGVVLALDARRFPRSSAGMSKVRLLVDRHETARARTSRFSGSSRACVRTSRTA